MIGAILGNDEDAVAGHHTVRAQFDFKLIHKAPKLRHADRPLVQEEEWCVWRQRQALVEDLVEAHNGHRTIPDVTPDPR